MISVEAAAAVVAVVTIVLAVDLYEDSKCETKIALYGPVVSIIVNELRRSIYICWNGFSGKSMLFLWNKVVYDGCNAGDHLENSGISLLYTGFSLDTQVSSIEHIQWPCFLALPHTTPPLCVGQ